MHSDRQPHLRMMEWADRTGLFVELLTADREPGVEDLVVIMATPDTSEGKYLHEVARLQKRAAAVSRRFTAQRRAGVPRFLVGLTTARSLHATQIAPEALEAMDEASARGGVPVFIIDSDGYSCAAIALRDPSVFG